MMQKDGNEMTLINVLSILFLTHVGRAAKVRKQPASLRSDPGPHHRNRRPTSPEYAPRHVAGNLGSVRRPGACAGTMRLYCMIPDFGGADCRDEGETFTQLPQLATRCQRSSPSPDRPRTSRELRPSSPLRHPRVRPVRPLERELPATIERR